MKLYHLSRDINHDGELTPFRPLNPAEWEDRNTKRICFSDSLAGCMMSIPDGGYNFDMLNIQEDFFGSSERTWKLFIIDTEEYNIEDSNIIYPEELYKKDLVRDARLTKEHWVTKPVQVKEKDTYIIKIRTWMDVGVKDLVEYKIWKEAVDGDGHLERVYHKYHPDEKIPSIVEIDLVEYTIMEDGKVVMEIEEDRDGEDKIYNIKGDEINGKANSII
jgi:hypothetical protein